MSMVLRSVGFLGFLFGIASICEAQVVRMAAEIVKDKEARAAKEKEAQTIKERFEKERSEAVAAKYPEATLARADDLAGRGEKALAAGNKAAAARYFRDARWQLPYLPPGLPPHVVRVFGDSRLRHADRVNRVAYNAAGTRLASCSLDMTVKIWDLGNGREVCTYRGHQDQPDDPTKGTSNKLGVSSVAFHPTKPLVASAAGNQVHLWDAETGKPIKTLLNLGKVDKPVKPIAFSPDGKFLAVGADDGILRAVDVETGKVTYSSPARPSRIEAVAYSPNGKMIVVGDSNSQITVYSTSAKDEKQLLAAPGVDLGLVTDVAFSADGGAIFSAGQDPKVRLTAGPKPDGTTAITTVTRLREFIGHGDRVNALALTPDGTLLVTGSKDNSVRVWDVVSAKQIRGFQMHRADEGVTAVAVRSDGKQIAIGSADGGMRVVDLTAVDDHLALTGASDSLWATAYSPNGKRVAAAGNDGMIRVYDPATAKLEATLEGAKSPITSLAFFPDSNRLAAAGGDQVVAIWDVAQAKVLNTLRGHTSAILSVAVSADGSRVVSGSADRTVRLFSPEADKPLATWTGRSAVCAVGTHPSAKLVATGLADGSLVILDVSGQSPVEVWNRPAHVSGVACLAYAGNGRKLATVGGDGVLRVWDLNDKGLPVPPGVSFPSPSRTGTGGAPSPLTGVAFAKDNRYVATVGADQAVHVWDLESKMESRSLLGHTDWVTSVAFSPDGRAVASVGVEKDKTLRVFELPPLDQIAVGGHRLKVNAVAVSPNGKIAATASEDQTIRLWDIASGKEVATLVGNADVPIALAFLEDDALVLGARLPRPHESIGRLHFWTPSQARETKSGEIGAVYSVVPNAAGSKLLAWVVRPGVGEQKNNVYELYDAKGVLLASVPDRGRDVRAATFSPGLESAVAGDDKGNIAIWDIGAKKQSGTDWPLFTGPIQDLGITPDKKLLVAADQSGKVKVADMATRTVLATFSPHQAGVRTLLVSPTGKTFVTISDGQEVKAWLLDSAALKSPTAIRTWELPVGVNSLCYTPDGKQVVTANNDGTAYLLELP